MQCLRKSSLRSYCCWLTTDHRINLTIPTIDRCTDPHLVHSSNEQKSEAQFAKNMDMTFQSDPHSLLLIRVKALLPLNAAKTTKTILKQRRLLSKMRDSSIEITHAGEDHNTRQVLSFCSVEGCQQSHYAAGNCIIRRGVPEAIRCCDHRDGLEVGQQRSGQHR